MKISSIKWKGMSPATLMKGVAEALGTEDPEEFLRIVRTDAGQIMRAPWMGKKHLRKILRVLGEAGYDTTGIVVV